MDVPTKKKVFNKTFFMTTFCHELVSPLNGIIGFAELMYQEKIGAVTEKHKECLQHILTNAQYLLVLINDILDLSKIKAGKIQLNPEEINFKKIIQEAYDIFKTLITAKNIQFDSEIDPTLEKIILDPNRIKQILLNYVSNALKYTADNGKIKIRIISEDEKNFRLEVKDNGIGIKKENIKLLFTEFQQLNEDNTNKQLITGFGLGLALTKLIVEAQKGVVGVKSIYGKGSTFFAILPKHYK